MPDVVVRDRRQITLPAEICSALGLKTGDRLEVSIEGSALALRPRRVMALKALREIRRAFQESGVTEEELQAEGRRIREEITRERYGEG